MRRIYLAALLLVITASLYAQNVGIGTATPTHKLHVVGTTRSDTIAIGTSTPRAPLSFPQASGQKISLWDDGNVNGNNYGIGIQGGLLQIHAYSAADNIVFGYGSSNFFNEVMRVKASGNVGIGTTLPGNKLSVNGNADFSGNIGIGTASPSYRLHVNNGNNSLRIEGPAATGSGGAAVSIGGFGNIQIDKPGFTGGRFIIKENGNTGINNGNPGSTLDINGDLNFTGPLKISGNAGATRQILSSNGPGSNASWISPANIIKTEFGPSAPPVQLQLTNTDIIDLPASTYTVTLTVPSRVILFYKSRFYRDCYIGECASKVQLTVFLNGQYKNAYQVRATGLLTGTGAYWTDITNGPDYFDLPIGTHTFTFTAQCVWSPPLQIDEFRAYSTIIPL